MKVNTAKRCKSVALEFTVCLEAGKLQAPESEDEEETACKYWFFKKYAGKSGKQNGS